MHWEIWDKTAVAIYEDKSPLYIRNDIWTMIAIRNSAFHILIRLP
jgi:hypothetical protein